jgi:succinate dehydrogenase / fumarate reductase cytochrome b subunit
MERPLSPFMFPTWYRFQITSALSILHRLTGIALAVGSILLACGLVAVPAGGQVFAATHAFLASPIGVLLLLFLWSVAFFYAPNSWSIPIQLSNGFGLLSESRYASPMVF